MAVLTAATRGLEARFVRQLRRAVAMVSGANATCMGRRRRDGERDWDESPDQRQQQEENGGPALHFGSPVVEPQVKSA